MPQWQREYCAGVYLADDLVSYIHPSRTIRHLFAVRISGIHLVLFRRFPAAYEGITREPRGNHEGIEVPPNVI